jgi:hypothetical protein
MTRQQITPDSKYPIVLKPIVIGEKRNFFWLFPVPLTDAFGKRIDGEFIHGVIKKQSRAKAQISPAVQEQIDNAEVGFNGYEPIWGFMTPETWREHGQHRGRGRGRWYRKTDEGWLLTNPYRSIFYQWLNR